MAIAAAMLSSCGNSTPKASLKSDVDSMSYAIGVGQAQGLKEYLVYRMGVDTTYMDEFVKGLNEGASAGDDKKKAAYYAGIQIGQQISTQLVKGINHEVFGDDSTQTVSMKNLMAGFIGSVTGKKCLLVDDMIDTGGTIVQGAQALVDAGATNIYACCTHAVLSGPAIERIKNSPIEELVMLDTIHLPEEKMLPKMKILSVADIFAAAIENVYLDKPMSKIYD